MRLTIIQASKSPQADNTAPITRIINWLYEKHEVLVANEFAVQLKGTDKKSKLGTVSILRTLIDTSLNVSNKQKKTQRKTSQLISEVEDETPAAGFKVPRIHKSMILHLTSFKMFLAPLLQCVVENSVKTNDRKCQATMLTVTAADCFASLAYALAIASYNASLEDQPDEDVLDDTDMSKGIANRSIHYIILFVLILL